MSVCRFSRPTSCRPCLMAVMALSYMILSGFAVFSAFVDLLTLFFLWKICASHRVALSRNSPVITNRADRFALTRNVERLTVAKIEVRSKLHLFLESGIPHRGLPKPWALPDSPRFGTFNYTLNERPGRTTSFPLRPGPPNYPLFLMPLCSQR